MVGDVNGDSFPDAAIGAPGTSEKLGAVYFFYGGNDIDGDGFARVRADATSSDDASDDALDCDDLDSSAYPDADVDESVEVKVGVDRNCDGTIGAPDGCGCHATPDTRSGDRRGDGGGLRLALSAGIGAAVLARRRRPARGV